MDRVLETQVGYRDARPQPTWLGLDAAGPAERLKPFTTLRVEEFFDSACAQDESFEDDPLDSLDEALADLFTGV